MRRLTSGGHGYPDPREPYLHIFGNLGVDGIRLTDLAARAALAQGGHRHHQNVSGPGGRRPAGETAVSSWWELGPEPTPD
jgi:hypothetical protein